VTLFATAFFAASSLPPAPVESSSLDSDASDAFLPSSSLATLPCDLAVLVGCDLAVLVAGDLAVLVGG